MNKGKLRSLMFHAGFCNEDGGWDDRPIHEQEHDNFQKFAELIILECVETLGTYEETWTHKAQMELLKKHFGVE